MVEDPVCGMEVDEKSAIYKSEYKGRTYYSCSVHCKWEFDQNPKIFADYIPTNIKPKNIRRKPENTEKKYEKRRGITIVSSPSPFD